MRIRNAQNMAESDFCEKFFSGLKCWKYAGNRCFCRFLSDFFFTCSCFFFHRKTLFITMPSIKHGSIVNKTDFCSRNSLKFAGTADFRRKNGTSWISRAVLYIFLWNFAHRCKIAIPKMWRGPIFEKHFFRSKMPEMCRKSLFLQIFIGLFPWFRCFFTHKHYL